MDTGRRLGRTESNASMWWRTAPEGLGEMIEWGFLLIAELKCKRDSQTAVSVPRSTQDKPNIWIQVASCVCQALVPHIKQHNALEAGHRSKTPSAREISAMG